MGVPRPLVPVLAIGGFVVAVAVVTGMMGTQQVDEHHSSGSSASSVTAPHQPSEAQIEQLLRNLPPASTSGASDRTSPTADAPATSASGANGTAATAPPTTQQSPSETSISQGSGGDMNGVPNYAVGQSGTLWDPVNEVPLAIIKVSPPQFTSTDVSGDTSEYGYFATFTVTVTDIAPASSADSISPSDSDYYVRANGSQYGFGQDDLGNTEEAETGTDYLGSSVGGLEPGQSTSGTVTVDVPSEHGALVYAPNSTDAGMWSY